MSSPVAVNDSNQYDVLASPMDEGKSQEGIRARFGKDDIKEQAYQAREMIKTKALDLKEQVVNSGIINTVQAQLQGGIDMVKTSVGLSKDATNEELVAKAQDEAEGEWEEVKRKGNKNLKKASKIVDEKLDENLTPAQRSKLNKGINQAKKKGAQLERQAEGWSNSLVSSTLAGPRLRPVKNFIVRNNLALPVVILGSLITLWMGLSMIRLITSVTTPKVPEFDIHSKSATMDWARYHAGEYKNRAYDMKDSLTGRAATFLANHQFEKLRDSAVDYRDIALNKLGLAEPTWGEWAWAKITGRPITYQERVESVLSLAQDGIKSANLKAGGLFTGLKDRIVDGVDSIRSHLPGGESIEAARQRAYEATHPSTLDQLKNGATYLKNRVVHGAQEAAHIAQDRANEAADKVRYQTGL